MPQVQVIQPIQQQPKRLRVAAYARVSTKSNEQLHSMSVQTEYYEDLIQKNPNWEFVGVYADEGISGTSIKHRAELNRLMEDCRAGMIDRILVKSASRMARNTVDLLTLVRELKSIGVTVQFEKEQFDTDSATGEMMLSMMCAIAQEESLSISKNMKWGIRKKMQAGTYVNCATPFGYRQQNHQLVLERNKAAVVRLVFEKYLSGVGIAEIACYLNENHPKEGGWWYTSAVRFMLHNEAYKGDTLHQKHYTTDTLPFMVYHNEGQFPKYCAYKSHEAIVSDEEFEKVQNLLKKAAGLEIQYLCPLHGPIWRKNAAWFIEKYQRWSTYTPEDQGVVIAYGSVYGHTENAAAILANRLSEKGVHNIAMYDVSNTHPSVLVSEAFRCSHLVIASVTYNNGIFTPMETVLTDLKAHNLQNRTVAIIENGSWAPQAGKLIRACFEGMKNITVLEQGVTLKSSVKEGQRATLEELADQLASDILR